MPVRLFWNGFWEYDDKDAESLGCYGLFSSSRNRLPDCKSCVPRARHPRWSFPIVLVALEN